MIFEDQILNIYKPPGWTSFDIVKKIRNITRIRKVGHAGSLDPFASGVLLIAFSRATKQITTLMNLEKEYLGEIEFGLTTDSLDVTGEVVATYPTHHLTEPEVYATCGQFVGEIEQIPPVYSAIWVNGVRAYHLARSGETVHLQPRRVQIYRLEILDLKLPFLTIKVICSKGTYMRSLARDIGERLHCGGYLKSLVRTRIGEYRLEEALTLSQLMESVTTVKPVIGQNGSLF